MMNPNKVLLYSAMGILFLVMYFQFSKARFKTEVTKNIEPTKTINPKDFTFWEWILNSFTKRTI